MSLEWLRMLKSSVNPISLNSLDINITNTKNLLYHKYLKMSTTFSNISCRSVQCPWTVVKLLIYKGVMDFCPPIRKGDTPRVLIRHRITFSIGVAFKDWGVYSGGI